MISISQQLVKQHLGYDVARSLVRSGFIQAHRCGIESPARHVFVPRKASQVVGFMPAIDDLYISAKVAVVSLSESNHPSQKGLDRHQGAILLFDRISNRLIATIDATEITAIRTTAVTGLFAEKLLDAGRKIHKVCIIGAGVQAFHHIKMLAQDYLIQDFVVISSSEDRLNSLKSSLPSDLNITYRPYSSNIMDCDLVITATPAKETVLNKSQIPTNCSVIAIGACNIQSQELSQDILENCLFIVDNKQTYSSASGEGSYIHANKELTADDFSEFLLGDKSIPKSGIVVLKTVGQGFQDLVCSRYLYETISNQTPSEPHQPLGGLRAY